MSDAPPPPAIALDPETLEALSVQVIATLKEACGGTTGMEALRDMPSAWIDQDSKQVKKYGPERASYYVKWVDPDGHERCKSCGPGKEGHRLAQKMKRQIEAELLTGTYNSNSRKTWADFRAEYEEKVAAGKAKRTREEIKSALDDFQRLTKLTRMASLKADVVDTFIAKRRKEPGKYQGTTVSPATLNKQLRHLRAAFKKARKWRYIQEVPDFDFQREVERLVRYVLPEHFDAIYQACDAAALPEGQPYPASDWWRAAVVYLYMTGWRIGELLALPRTDIDLKTGHSITRGDDNKGKRDERIPLHPAVIEHLQRLAGFSERMFPWPIESNPTWKKELYAEWAKIQQAAGIHLDCPKRHEHTDACRRYGFHDLRRAFATENAADMEPKVLQKWMRHKSYSTTMVYSAMAENKLEATLDKLKVPDVLKRRATG
jgi:integrase